jgi:phosphoribosyl 1,2-cyclic phosphate phosphodiesterase
VGPDYRRQALAHGIDKIDGFILTHAHYDHMAGIDDLKIYSHGKGKVPTFSLHSTLQEVKLRYGYLFKPLAGEENNSPFFEWQFVTEPFGKTVFEQMPFTYVTFFQSGMQVLGLKIGDLAYISDIKEYDDRLLEYLQGTKTLIVSALRQTTSAAHFSIEQACRFADLVQPKTTYLTHIAHEVDHDEVQKSLPPFVFLAYDGLKISFSME